MKLYAYAYTIRRISEESKEGTIGKYGSVDAPLQKSRK